MDLGAKEDRRLMDAARACCRLFAHHVHPSAFMPIVLRQLSPTAAASPRARAATARVLAAILEAMPPWHRGPFVASTLDAICDEDTLVTSDSATRLALASLLRAAVAAGASAEAVAEARSIPDDQPSLRSGTARRGTEASEAPPVADDDPSSPAEPELGAIVERGPQILCAAARLASGALARGERAATEDGEAVCACADAVRRAGLVLKHADEHPADSESDVLAYRVWGPACVEAFVESGAPWCMPCPERRVLCHLLESCPEPDALASADPALMRALGGSAEEGASPAVIAGAVALVRGLCRRSPGPWAPAVIHHFFQPLAPVLVALAPAEAEVVLRTTAASMGDVGIITSMHVSAAATLTQVLRAVPSSAVQRVTFGVFLHLQSQWLQWADDLASASVSGQGQATTGAGGHQARLLADGASASAAITLHLLAEAQASLDDEAGLVTHVFSLGQSIARCAQAPFPSSATSREQLRQAITAWENVVAGFTAAGADVDKDTLRRVREGCAASGLLDQVSSSV